jgi:Reverse transcriptase (RNA-dependent DNA polymerase)
MEGKEPKPQHIYSLSEKELQVLREYINENLKKGYIRPSISLARYPVLFVPKSNGKLRMCVDYRQLNTITVKNRYTLSLIHEMQDRIKGSKIFTKIDIREGYYKIRMKEGEEWKTVWGFRLGHYEQLVILFGLINAPASFQALINDIFREYLDIFVVAYLDDILIYLTNEKDHIKQVNLVLEALGKAGMRINGPKCTFHAKEVEFLGYIVGSDGIKMDPKKV